MSQPNASRRGSLQYWPRKRCTHSSVRIRTWVPNNQAKILGFIGYKAGMTHILANDNRPKSDTKGETVMIPATIVDCPPMFVHGVSFYQHSHKITSIFAEKTVPELGMKLTLPKKPAKSMSNVKEFDDVRLLINSQPKYASSIGTKMPKILELALNGSKTDKFNYAQSVLGKEISVKEALGELHLVDIRGVTKGKGFQGTVKRYGVPIRQHKAEKTKRGIGNLGSWTPKRVQFTVAQPGKMGYHQRTEYNKEILKVGEQGSDLNPAGGIINYGLVRGNYVLIKGSIPGPKKRAVVLTPAVRPNRKMTKGAYDIKAIAK